MFSWVNISSINVPYGQIGQIQTLAQGFAMDPSRPRTIYSCVSAFNSTTFDIAPGGLFRSTDVGATWRQVGPFDSPAAVAVDPNDSNHIYVVDGVRGNTGGFWRSTDFGATWEQPASFITASQSVGTLDLYSIAVDPTNFNHFVISFHSPWNGFSSNAGVFESTDGGSTWNIIQPDVGMSGIGYFVNFLYDPASGQGNSSTWLLCTQGSGLWKTVNSGANWTQVSTNSMPHGGTLTTYANGVVYAGISNGLMRSIDNGSTWSVISSLPGKGFLTVLYDGISLYIQQNGFVDPVPQPVLVSPATDGQNWVPFNTQLLSSGFAQGAYNPQDNILYASMWELGIWALVPLPPTVPDAGVTFSGMNF